MTQSHLVVIKPACCFAESIVCDRSHLNILPDSNVVNRIEIINMTKKTTTWRRMISGKALNKDLTAIFKPWAR